jgi:hypothetical protein
MSAHTHHRTSRDRMLDAAREMPMLKHFHAGRTFRIEESDAARWLCAHPDVMQHIFNVAKLTGAIVWVDGKWMGSKAYAERSAVLQ